MAYSGTNKRLRGGVSASPGFAMAKAYVFNRDEVEVSAKVSADPAIESRKFSEALRRVRDRTAELRRTTSASAGEDAAEIFDAHLTIIEDAEFIDPIESAIREKGYSASFAVKESTDRIIDLFSSMDDEYMREREADIRDIARRLIREIEGRPEGRSGLGDEKRIVVAEDLTPSETIGLDLDTLAGIVTSRGGRTSHAAILARSLGIPAVVGIGAAIEEIASGDLLLLDGGNAELTVSPTEAEIAEFDQSRAAYAARREELRSFVHARTRTADRRNLELAANIGSLRDLDNAIEQGAEGIGLFRTEFLFMCRDAAPTEDEQFETYRRAAVAMEGKPVIVRTLDVGGDKPVAYLDLPDEDNPFLGLRAIRLCFAEPAVFRTQLRALLRAGTFGDLRIMLPMISSLEELRKAKGFIREVEAELEREGVDFRRGMKVGIMVEIPAVAVLAEHFAKECDFFSIGTNDLVQYSVAVDRGNRSLCHLYSAYHPAVLNLIATAARAANRAGIECGMCGEAAGDMDLIPVFIGLGLSELSLDANSIPEARKRISEIIYREEEGRAHCLLSLPTAEDVRSAVRSS